MKKTILIPLAIALLAPAHASAATCKLGTLPDHACTPGAVLAVTSQEVCTPGYATKTRSVSAATRRKVFRRYGVAKRKQSRYVIDHLVSLELGGSNVLANLFPQSLAQGHKKDKLENKLHQSICDGEIAVSDAQRIISENWVSAYKRFFP